MIHDVIRHTSYTYTLNLAGFAYYLSLVNTCIIIFSDKITIILSRVRCNKIVKFKNQTYYKILKFYLQNQRDYNISLTLIF